MKKSVSLVRTALALGVQNLLRVLYYRVSVKLGINPVRSLRARIPVAPFFKGMGTPRLNVPEPTMQWWGEVHYFGVSPVRVSERPPDWHVNPINGQYVKQPMRPWWQIADFDVEVGDIKCVWEASRFDWLLAFAQRTVMGNQEAFSRLESWLADWCEKNPPYLGPNWKCGQEASIRVMHLAMAARLLEQHRTPQSALLDLIDLHLQRIAPTISYAVAQDNNHGTSEAAALFIGGSWLALCRPDSRGRYWEKIGRRWLENRVGRLIETDGSFSQYSVNYHRVMIDTLSMVEIWRKTLKLDGFSAHFQFKAQAATTWLCRMVRPNGDVPNIGANDGARLLPLTATGYRDFRPSVQLAMVLFKNCLAYENDGSDNAILGWLAIDLPDHVEKSDQSICFDQGGYVCLVQNQSFAVLRYPRFHFRPSQADALHVDFWLNDVNVLRDAGSYSYNTEARWLNYFPATVSHNTIQFDDRDQMLRLSRFLFGDWLKTKSRAVLFATDQQTCEASYRDIWGACHSRQLSLSDQRLMVEDCISGFQEKAVLRWRLVPGDWTLQGQTISNGQISLTLSSDVPFSRIEIVEGWESRYYLQRTVLPVLEVEVNQAGRIRTIVEWMI